MKASPTSCSDRGQDYLKRVSILPPAYRRISHGEEISIGTRRFKVITGGGHALDQVMLYCAADKLFLSADQVLSKISPNVSVWAVEPDQNSLGEYLASLASLTTTLPYDLLVLPGHGVPFYGLKTRIKQLADHHEDRCRTDRRCLPGNPEDIQGTGAGGVPQARAGRAPDGLRRRRADRPCQLHAGRRAPEGRRNRRRAALQDHLTGQDGNTAPRFRFHWTELLWNDEVLLGLRTRRRRVLPENNPVDGLAVHVHWRVVVLLSSFGDRTLEAGILGTFLTVDVRCDIPCLFISQGIALAERHIRFDEPCGIGD